MTWAGRLTSKAVLTVVKKSVVLLLAHSRAITQVDAVVMVASDPVKGSRNAVLYDTGCPTLMTKSTGGLVNGLRETKPVSFETAAGTQVVRQVGEFCRVLYGSNGASIETLQTWYYNPLLPWDIVGPQPLRDEFGLFYVDCHEKTVNTAPELHMRKLNVTLTLARTANGLEWLSYVSPKKPFGSRCPAGVRWSEEEKAALQTVAREQHAACPLGSSGAGMGRLTAVLTPLQKAVLDHVRRGHTSLDRAARSAKRTVGGMGHASESGGHG